MINFLTCLVLITLVWDHGGAEKFRIWVDKPYGYALVAEVGDVREASFESTGYNKYFATAVNEFGESMLSEPCEVFSKADFDEDGDVDAADLEFFTKEYGR